MRIEELRLLNLTHLINTDFSGSKAAFAARIGKNPSYVSRWYSKNNKHKRNIGGDTAREIEEACGYPDGWLDANHQLVNDKASPGYNLTGTALAASETGAEKRQENRHKPRRVPVFNDRDILNRSSAKDRSKTGDTQTVATSANVSDQAYCWQTQSSELGDINLPFPVPVMAHMIVEPALRPTNNDIVVVTDDQDNVMVRRYEFDPPHAYLHSLKGMREPIRIDEGYHISGVVISMELMTR